MAERRSLMDDLYFKSQQLEEDNDRLKAEGNVREARVSALEEENEQLKERSHEEAALNAKLQEENARQEERSQELTALYAKLQEENAKLKSDVVTVACEKDGMKDVVMKLRDELTKTNLALAKEKDMRQPAEEVLSSSSDLSEEFVLENSEPQASDSYIGYVDTVTTKKEKMDRRCKNCGKTVSAKTPLTFHIALHLRWGMRCPVESCDVIKTHIYNHLKDVHNLRVGKLTDEQRKRYYESKRRFNEKIDKVKHRYFSY